MLLQCHRSNRLQVRNDMVNGHDLTKITITELFYGLLYEQQLPLFRDTFCNNFKFLVRSVL